MVGITVTVQEDEVPDDATLVDPPAVDASPAVAPESAGEAMDVDAQAQPESSYVSPDPLPVAEEEWPEPEEITLV